MQQALLGRGSNRKTAAGGLKEAVLERCACAPQNMEKGGGSRDDDTVSRKGRGHFAPPQSASAHGPQDGGRTASEDETVSAACNGDVQRRNKSHLHVGSHSPKEGPRVMWMATEVATDSGMDSDGAEGSECAQSGVSASSSGSYGLGQELEMAAGGLLLPRPATDTTSTGTAGGQKRSMNDTGEEEADRAAGNFMQQLGVCIDSGNLATTAWLEEARRSAAMATVHAQQMSMASAVVSAMTSLAEARVLQCSGDVSKLHHADQTIAAMAAESEAASVQAARTFEAIGQRTVGLAGLVTGALATIAVSTESLASEIRSAVAVATSGAKRQKAAAAGCSSGDHPRRTVGEPSVGMDEQEPDWLRQAMAEMIATEDCTVTMPQDSEEQKPQRMASAVPRVLAVCTLQQAWRRRYRRRVVDVASAAAAAHLALARRQREARARLDEREAEEALRRRPAVKGPNSSIRRNSQRRDAAVRIQATWRGVQGRDAARQQRAIRSQAALCIQAMQARFANAQKRSAAATCIQAAWRRFCVRRKQIRSPPAIKEATPLLLAMGDAGRSRRSGGRQRRAARLTHQRAAIQQESAAYDWAVVQRARAEMAVAMGEDWEERAQSNLERSRLRYADGLSRLASELAPPRRKRLEYATWS